MQNHITSLLQSPASLGNVHFRSSTLPECHLLQQSRVSGRVGLHRIKLSPLPLCVNLLLQTFSYLIHFHPLHRGCTKFSVSASASGTGVRIAGTVKWLSAQRTPRCVLGEHSCARPAEPGIGRGARRPAICLGVTPKPKSWLFSKQERKL